MAIQVSYPGVYIDEFTPGAPIEGVGTSTAAFLGLSKYGNPNEPAKLTSWDGFLSKFGPDKPEDTDYLWYAVRGFFENGGKVCFVTAVSNAKPDTVILKDDNSAAPTPTVRVSARRTGKNSPEITVEAVESHLVDAKTLPAINPKLFSPTATITAIAQGVRAFEVTDAAEAAQFLPGDEILIDDGTNSEQSIITRVNGTVISTVAPLNAHVAGKKLKLVLNPFTRTFRAVDVEGLVSGSIITLWQSASATPPANAPVTIVESVFRERLSATLTTYRVTVKDGLTGFNLYDAIPIKLRSEEFTLTVHQGSTYSKLYSGLSMNPGHPQYFTNVINNDSIGIIFVSSVEPPSTTAIPKNRPKTTTPQELGGGEDHDPSSVNANDYKEALRLLEGIDDINLVAVPDRTDEDVQSAVIDHCKRMKDRFAILDARRSRGAPLFGTGSVETQRAGCESDTGVAALYFPWLEVSSAQSAKRILVPPSGHVAGIYARIDNSRGVHKAPAGTEAIVSGALGVERLLSDDDHGQLNSQGINVIRVFQSGGRPVVWGARTTSKNTNWQYVNIRRLFLFLEESIQEGINWAVFEPNDLALWGKLKRTIRAFLMTQWRDGALFGKTAEEAFYIRIDEVLNPFSEQALGRLTIEIGVRPSYPAEFIVVRIGIWQGGSDVSEV